MAAAFYISIFFLNFFNADFLIEHIFSLVSNGHLKIRKSSKRKDAGRYTCVAQGKKADLHITFNNFMDVLQVSIAIFMFHHMICGDIKKLKEENSHFARNISIHKKSWISSRLE